MSDRGSFRPRTAPMVEDDPVVQWLLQGIRRSAGRCCAISWMPRTARWRPNERGSSTRAGGARLLALRAGDGTWADGACFPGTAAFAAATARALAAGEPPPPWPSAAADTAEAPTEGQPWTATYQVLLDLCDRGHRRTDR